MPKKQVVHKSVADQKVSAKQMELLPSVSVSLPSVSLPAQKSDSQKSDLPQLKESKYSRTLIVKSVNSQTIDDSYFDNYVGLVNKADTKSENKSYFLTFDNVTNSSKALLDLNKKSELYNAKFSYYRVFFTINGLTDAFKYDTVKQNLTEYVTKHTGALVLFFKLYRKDNKYLGCGDLTVDTLESLNHLLNKDEGNKNFTIESLTGTFYRYKNNNVRSSN